MFRRGNSQGRGLATGKPKREKAASSKIGLPNVVHAEQPHHLKGTFPQLPSEKKQTIEINIKETQSIKRTHLKYTFKNSRKTIENSRHNFEK